MSSLELHNGVDISGLDDDGEVEFEVPHYRAVFWLGRQQALLVVSHLIKVFEYSVEEIQDVKFRCNNSSDPTR